MYYAETRADNSGNTNHRVICLVVMGSPFDNEHVCRVEEILSHLIVNSSTGMSSFISLPKPTKLCVFPIDRLTLKFYRRP
jgi:hypothetical protein